MADNVLVKYSGDWILYQGATVSGALLYVYNEDTTDLASIYSDRDLGVALANPVTADSGGLMPFAYIGTQAYKVIIKTSAGVTIDEEDDLPGALDTSTFTAATFAKPDTDCTAKTTDYTMVSGDLGTVLNCNPTSAAFTITLMSAVTATNGRGITIRHLGTANQVKIAAAAQTISQPATGVTVSDFAIVGYGESVTLTSDGANWHVTAYVPPLMRPNTPGIIKIADRVSAAPSSPAAGDRFIVTGAYSTFEQEDIIEYTGSGYIEYSPPTDCGWLAYVQDEDSFYAHIGSAWVERLRPATQAEQEAKTATTAFVAPATQHHHPSAAKGWCVCDSNGAIAASYNVSSITDGGTGVVTFTWETDFSSGNYVIVGAATLNRGLIFVPQTLNAGSTLVNTYNDANAIADGTGIYAAAFGDQ